MVLTLVADLWWCQSPRNMQVSQPCNFACSMNHITKDSQSSLCILELPLSPKCMSVKQATFLKNAILIHFLYFYFFIKTRKCECWNGMMYVRVSVDIWIPYS